MRRWLMFLVVGVLGVALLRADGAPPDDEPLRQFRRNRGLIEEIVEASLRLAAEDDPLKRADCCAGVAERLAREIQESTAQRETDRAEEMEHLLTDLLQQGVAPNLTRARHAIPPGTSEEEKLLDLQRRVVGVAGTLGDGPREEIRRSLQFRGLRPSLGNEKR